MLETRVTRLQRLVRAHFSEVWRLLRHLGVPETRVEDAAQEVFLVATARIDEILPDRERAFLYGTAVRVAHGERRKHVRETPEEMEGERAADPNPEESFRTKETREILRALLGQLDDDLRAAFVLYEIEGLTVQEVGAVLGVPAGTAASRLRRAREDFAARLERYRKRWGERP
jgi:RNA polymerase sigma-70 factor (ECF subfamily)